MTEISLTEFVDFAIKSGTPKLTKVREIKRQHELGYHPAHDYYRKLREGFVAYHQDGLDKKYVDGLARNIGDKNKCETYPVLAKAYKKFLGRKQLAWFEPPRAEWTFSDLGVRVNPELGLTMDGEDYLVKLYFKDEKLTKNRLAIINNLMLNGLGDLAEGCRIGILDVRHSKLHVFDSADPALEPLLEGEALAFCRMYEGA